MVSHVTIPPKRRERIRTRRAPCNPVVFAPSKRCKWIDARDARQALMVLGAAAIYCGLPSVQQSSYCEAHLRRAYLRWHC
jgi:hypothetical protein